MSQTKDILKFNRDIILTELKNTLIGVYNNQRKELEKNIKTFAEFSQKLNKGQIPENTAYKKLLFKNALDVPFAKEELDNILDSGDALMSFNAFPTVVPRAYMGALNQYERCYYRASTLSNKNIVNLIIDMSLEQIMTMHEHQDYTHRGDNSGKPEEEPVDSFKKKKFRKVKE